MERLAPAISDRRNLGRVSDYVDDESQEWQFEQLL
jgi:hypothetical protein